jgi:hypothetical protein
MCRPSHDRWIVQQQDQNSRDSRGDTAQHVQTCDRAVPSWDAFPARSRTRVLDPSSSDQIVGVGHRIRGWQRLAMREEGAISRTRHAVKPRLDTRTLK